MVQFTGFTANRSMNDDVFLHTKADSKKKKKPNRCKTAATRKSFRGMKR
jgi:hypothetical protein